MTTELNDPAYALEFFGTELRSNLIIQIEKRLSSELHDRLLFNMHHPAAVFNNVVNTLLYNVQREHSELPFGKYLQSYSFEF